MNMPLFDTSHLFEVPADARKAERVLARLWEHFDRPPIVTGGIAALWHLQAADRDIKKSRLNDLDLVVENAEMLPLTLSRDFLISHFHPTRDRGKTLIQLVDEREGIRIDIFTPYSPSIGQRVVKATMRNREVPIVSREDLTARLASVIHPGRSASTVDPKHHEKFVALSAIVDPAILQLVWADYRDATQPIGYSQVAAELTEYVALNPMYLQRDCYDRGPHTECAWCIHDDRFTLSSGQAIFDVLGYR